MRRLRRLDQMIEYLSKRSGQLRVRATLTLALGCGVLAYQFGFASILGAFAAGLLVRIIELSGRQPNRDFLNKLDGIGFGFLVPIFFIGTGVAFQLKGLLDHPAALAEVPLFLVALLVVRGVPALLYVPTVGRRRAAAGGLLQATTLSRRPWRLRRRGRRAWRGRRRRRRRRGSAPAAEVRARIRAPARENLTGARRGYRVRGLRRALGSGGAGSRRGVPA